MFFVFVAMAAKRLRGWALEKETGAAGSACKPSLTDHSALATKLLSLWAHGLLSAALIQDLAYLAILDGASHDELFALSKAGNFGENSGSVSRDIATTFCQGLAFETHEVEVSCIDPKTNNEVLANASIFLPHVLFATLAREYSEQFPSLFNTGILEQFWKSAEKTADDRLTGHPMTSKSDWRKKTIPLFIHGDGVEFQTRDTLLVWSWGSLLSLFSSLDSHFLISVFPKSCTTASTWLPLMKWLVWSLKALLTGKHPVNDPEGNPIQEPSPFFLAKGKPLTSQGYRGAIWSIQGDHDFFSNVLLLPHWNNSHPCWMCDCRKEGPKNFRNIKPSLRNFVSVDSAAAAANPASAHPIFSTPGVTSRMVRGDGLHILFTKGIYAHLLGSILHYMCWKDGPGARQAVPPSQRLALIFERVQSCYKARKSPTRLTNLKLSMFTKPDKPHQTWAFLNAKGAECKHLAPALLDVCKQVLDPTNAVDSHIVNALESMVTVVDLLDKCNMFLSPSEFDSVLRRADLFLDNYDWLNKWALEEERMLFHVVIKFHMFWHLIENSKFLNPRYHWCFKSEDFVGRVSRLAFSVTMSVSSIKICLKVCPKYSFLLHLRLTRPGFGLELNADDS